MSSNLKNQLIKLGSENPELRKHLKPVLDKISMKNQSSADPASFGKITWDDLQTEVRNAWKKLQVKVNEKKMSVEDIREMMLEEFPTKRTPKNFRERYEGLSRREKRELMEDAFTSKDRDYLLFASERKTANSRFLKQFIDINNYRDLTRRDDLAAPMVDSLGDVMMELSERLAPDRDTEAALNRLQNLLRNPKRLPPEAVANQVMKIKDKLGLL